MTVFLAVLEVWLLPIWHRPFEPFEEWWMKVCDEIGETTTGGW